MLKDPFLNEQFVPDLMWFIGQFDVYDREETRGVALGVYDPNDKHDRSELIVKYALDLACLSYRHKYVLVVFLEEALKDPNYDFQALFEIDEDCAGSWPRGEWYNLKNPREFFHDVFVLAKEVWREDLKTAAREDPSTW
ncbi:hypothetical protein [Pseudomonas mediterranea]|jgi:hypothetical protein|uniref:Uncharacterized protein n=1 Tax=Pseudomonas mediterranea TaxID=183795 RepID=A0AAX2DAD6_9PSED|nr:hypothetical protein [Pseudomonas mediterranea]KGU85809.1 hypothetical protein N005_07035 [Pseudomonas mediterranea CFBP 5447]UZD99678.1 hypothetical protein LOY71_19400 [Pseudomonas mediterranea]SDU43815.1 hypothetical protein SAMN05216476_2128 [Pseudomonas mediterranea]